MTSVPPNMSDVLVGYAGTATFVDGTVDRFITYEPQAISNGPRALVKLVGLRTMFETIGARVDVESVWLSREQAILQGFLIGS